MAIAVIVTFVVVTAIGQALAQPDPVSVVTAQETTDLVAFLRAL